MGDWRHECGCLPDDVEIKYIEMYDKCILYIIEEDDYYGKQYIHSKEKINYCPYCGLNLSGKEQITIGEKMNKQICMDCDGVILNTMEKFLEVYNNLYDKDGYIPKIYEDINKWDFFEDWGVPEDVVWNIFDVVKANILNLNIIDKLIPKFLRKMSKNNTVDIVTAREDNCRKDLTERFRRYNIIKGIHYKILHIIGRNNILHKIKMGYDVYVDDSPDLAIAVKEFNKDRNNKIKRQIKLLLFDQPWNRDIENGYGVYRVSDWRDLWKKIQWFL